MLFLNYIMHFFFIVSVTIRERKIIACTQLSVMNCSFTVLFVLKLSFCFIMSNGLFHQTCNYFQHLKPGIIYYVYNPDYPNVSNGLHHCKWIAESDYRVRLTCNSFNIPWVRFVFCYRIAHDY